MALMLASNILDRGDSCHYCRGEFSTGAGDEVETGQLSARGFRSAGLWMAVRGRDWRLEIWFRRSGVRYQGHARLDHWG